MPLESALRINAAFSVATGFALGLAPSKVGGWLDVSIPGWLRLLGIALIAHGVMVVWASGQPSVKFWAKLNVAAIAPYPLVMIVLVVTGLVGSSLGRGLVLLDGTIVGLLAIAQWQGLRAETAKAHSVPA